MSDNQALGSAYYIKHVTIISVFMGLACVAVVLRVWARKIQKMSLELNDFLIISGLLCALGESAVNIYGCCFGLAKHMSPEDRMKAIIFSQKSQFMSIIIWVASVTFIRASIIFLYIHLFPTCIFRRICYTVLVANLCFFISTVLADCLICKPISYRWNREIGGTGSCGDEKSLDLFIGISNLILDVTAVVLPMPILWGLKMAVGKKVMLSAMFGMGTAICALTLYRIYDTATISAATAQEAYAVIAMLTSLEALLGVINACLPVLKPIYNKIRSTTPKDSNGSRVSQILKSGTIPIFMRIGDMFTLTSRKEKHSLSDDETLTETTSGWYDDKKTRKSGSVGRKGASVMTNEISPLTTEKAERMMGIKIPKIYVRRDVDVESVVGRDERGLAGERWEESLDIQLDLFLPRELGEGLVPALVHFHGGGMIAGCRKTLFFQHWLKDAALEHGILFISADHRLLYPSTAFDIITDVKNLFAFLASPIFSETHLPAGVTLDASRIAVSGESGGGYATRAAGISAAPKPRALLLQYAQGGQLLDDHWLAVKKLDEPDPEGGFIPRDSIAHLLDHTQAPISDDPMPFLGDEAPNGDSGRTKLLLWWWRIGVFVDVLLGVNGISRWLRKFSPAEREGYLTEPLRTAILQTQISENFPPTFFLHGKEDKLVLPNESQVTYDRLMELGVEAELHMVEGAGHTLIDEKDPPNLAAGAQEGQQKAVEWLVKKLEG